MAEKRPAKEWSPAAVATVTIAVIAVLFAMREAKVVVVPALLAFFLAVVADLPVSWLERKKLPRSLAVLLVVTAMTLVTVGIGALVGPSLQELLEKVPAFQKRIRAQLDSLLVDLGGTEAGTESSGLLDYLSPDAALGLAATVLAGVRDLLGNAFIILLLMIFMLFEFPSLRAKLRALGATRGGPAASIPEVVRGYLAIKTLTSLATGALVGFFLHVLSVDFAILWGLLAFLLNYIPNIGSFVASLPAVLLSFLQNGLGAALIVAAGYLVINLAIGNGVEPRVLGKGFGLSTLMVVLSLILWGWLLGPIGMLISVPLTTTVKIALERHERTQPIALLLGRGRPDQP